MKTNVKAALLSALVFPGLGQLYKGARVKGIILFVCANILLLIAFFLVMRQLLTLVLSTQGKDPAEMAIILIDKLGTESSSFRILLGALGGIWCYGLIDAAVGKKVRE